jgi:hypothetical protein
LGRRAWSGEGVSSVAYVAGEEGILEMELCRDERDGRSVRVIVLYLSSVIASEGKLTVRLMLSGIHLFISTDLRSG